MITRQLVGKRARSTRRATRRMEMSDAQPTRREVLKKAVYTTPAILTLPAIASFASHGSGREKDDDKDKPEKKDKKNK
jgi:hypothetical protein